MSRLPRGDREGALATMVDMMFGGLGIATVFFLAFVLVRLKSLPQDQPDLKSFIITINSISSAGNVTDLSGATLGLIIKRGNHVWYNTETKIEGIRLNPSSIRPRKEPAWNWATPQWVVEVLNRPKKADQLIVYLATPPFGHSIGQEMTVKIDVSALAVPQTGDKTSFPAEAGDLQLSSENGWMQTYSLQSLSEDNKIKCEEDIPKLNSVSPKLFIDLHSNNLKKTLPSQFLENKNPNSDISSANRLNKSIRGKIRSGRSLYYRTSKYPKRPDISLVLLSGLSENPTLEEQPNSCFHFSVMELEPLGTGQDSIVPRENYLLQIANFYFTHEDVFVTTLENKTDDKWCLALNCENKNTSWGDTWFYFSLGTNNNLKPRFAVCRCEETPTVLNLTSFAAAADSSDKIGFNLSPELYEKLRRPNDELRAAQKRTARLIEQQVRSVGDFSNVEWSGVGTNAVCILPESTPEKIKLHQHLPKSKPETFSLSLVKNPNSYFWILEKSKIKLFQTKFSPDSITDKDILKLWSLVLISDSEVHAKLGLRQHPQLIWQKH